jgi:hypothetical protein
MNTGRWQRIFVIQGIGPERFAHESEVFGANGNVRLFVDAAFAAEKRQQQKANGAQANHQFHPGEGQLAAT